MSDFLEYIFVLRFSLTLSCYAGVLGSCAPCLLYASNVERLYPTTENTFTNHFLAYSGLLCLGNLFFGFNALSPCFSYANRTEIRQRFNLMVSIPRVCGEGGGVRHLTQSFIIIIIKQQLLCFFRGLVNALQNHVGAQVVLAKVRTVNASRV